MPRHVKLSEDAREMVYRVYVYFTLEAEKFETDTKYFQKVRFRVQQATGVPNKSIYNLITAKGRPGSEAFTKALEEIKRSGETYNTQDQGDESAAKKRKINECQTDNEAVVASEPMQNQTKQPIAKTNEQNIEIKEKPGVVTKTKQYVRTTTVYTTKAGSVISKLNDIEKILGIQQPQLEPQSHVTLIKALPNLSKTQNVSQKATEKPKCPPELVFIKAKNSNQHIGLPSGSTSTKKPERTVIKVHRIRKTNPEIITTPETPNIVLRPIVTPNFVKLEANYKPADTDYFMNPDNVKVEIKHESNNTSPDEF